MGNNDVIIRLARRTDFEEMHALYRHYIYNTAVTFETTDPGYMEFAGRIRRVMKKYPCIVAEEDESIIGFAYADAFKGRAAYDWSVETSIYLEQNQRRRGDLPLVTALAQPPVALVGVGQDLVWHHVTIFDRVPALCYFGITGGQIGFARNDPLPGTVGTAMAFIRPEPDKAFPLVSLLALPPNRFFAARSHVLRSNLPILRGMPLGCDVGR